MERLGVGRPAIREAMQSLETIGLIEIRHGERARVAEPSIGRMVDQISDTMKHILSHSPASLENLKEARATFEKEIARIAARRRSDTDIARLEEIVAEQGGAIGDPAKFRSPRRPLPPRDRGDRRQSDLHRPDRRAVRLARGFPRRPGLGARARAADAARASRHLDGDRAGRRRRRPRRRWPTICCAPTHLYRQSHLPRVEPGASSARPRRAGDVAH